MKLNDHHPSYMYITVYGTPVILFQISSRSDQGDIILAYTLS